MLSTCLRIRRALPVASLLVLAAPAARAADPCDGFTWPVAQERALFAGTARAVAAGRDAAGAPLVEGAHLYQVQLLAQPDVAFAVAPGKKRLTDGARAGVVRFELRQPGRYRMSAALDVWIDVVADGQLVPSRDFRGMQGCQAPHKIVEYDLPRTGSYLLQLSGSAAESVGIAITPAPAPAPASAPATPAPAAPPPAAGT